MKDSKFSFSQRLTIAVVPRLVAFLLRLLHRTLRYEVVVEPGAQAAEAAGAAGVVFLAPLPYFVRLLFLRAIQPDGVHPAVLISRSFDGELIARTVERLGFLTARGSSTRFGGSGLLALAKALEHGHPAVFTADGPTGPVYKAKPGAVKLAQFTGYAIGILYAHPSESVDPALMGSIHDPQAFFPGGYQLGPPC